MPKLMPNSFPFPKGFTGRLQIFIFWICFSIFGTTFNMNAQEEQKTQFNYKAKLTDTETEEKQKEVISTFKSVFKTDALFTQGCDCFTFHSLMSINSTAFNHLMEGEGYHVVSFEKEEVPILSDPNKNKEAEHEGVKN